MDWKNMPLSHKIATVISCIAVAVWMVSEIKPDLLPMDPTIPSIAVFTVCEAVVCWQTRRKWAYLLIAGAVISIGFFMMDLFLL